MEFQLDLLQIGQVIQIGMHDATVLHEVGFGACRGKDASKGNLRQSAFEGGIGFGTVAGKDLACPFNEWLIRAVGDVIQHSPERRRRARPGIVEPAKELNLYSVDQRVAECMCCHRPFSWVAHPAHSALAEVLTQADALKRTPALRGARTGV